MCGRKPLPTAIKLANGNPGKRPINMRAEAGDGDPHLPCAPHADRQGRVEADGAPPSQARRHQRTRAPLAAYCQAYGRWVEAEKKLKETPPLLRTPAGYVQPSPWLAISNKNLELMHKFMGELGLSPVSRSRVSTTRDIGPKPWEFTGEEDDEIERKFFS